MKIAAKSLLRTFAFGLFLVVHFINTVAFAQGIFRPGASDEHIPQWICNGGKIEVKTIEGWGFPRYNVSKLGPMAGTRMAVNPDERKGNRFTLGGEPFLIRYNRRLPIVVYAPEGVEVRYRLWSAGPEAKVIEEG